MLALGVGDAGAEGLPVGAGDAWGAEDGQKPLKGFTLTKVFVTPFISSPSAWRRSYAERKTITSRGVPGEEGITNP